MKKDARTSAQLQIRRLERAMRTNRRIAHELFLDAYALHPWMRHLARRLVWGAFDADGKLRTTFRVAEDGTLADSKDDTFVLPADVRAGVMHPIHLDEKTFAAWGQLFAEYELTQPFAQLARSVHVPTTEEKNGKTIDRFRGRKVTAGAMRGLQSRGWERWMDDIVRFAKRISGDSWVELVTEPGWHPSQSADEIEEQTIVSAELHGPQTLGALAPMDFSEIVCDVEAILG
jgi:hypothetical protein